MTTNAGAVQGGGLPPVEDADINPPVDQGSEAKSTAPKAEKQQAPTQRDGEGGKETTPEPNAKEKGPGPWDAELAKRGLNDPRFSDFMREVVQPHVTQLEQGGQGGGPIAELFGGDVESAQAASELLTELRDNPEQAYRDLGEMLAELGHNIAPQGMDGMDPSLEGGEGLPPDMGLDGADPQAQPDPRLEYVDQMMQREQEEREDQEYETFLSQMGERMPGFDSELFTQLVVAQAGDLDRAMAIYQKYHKAPDPSETAPPSATGGTPPPAAPNYNSIGDAVSGWMAEDKAANPRR